MNDSNRQLQALLQAVHAATAALEELSFALHRASGSPEALKAQALAHRAIAASGKKSIQS